MKTRSRMDVRWLFGVAAAAGMPALAGHLLGVAAAAPVPLLLSGTPTPLQQRLDQAPAGPYRMGWEPAPMLVGPPES